MNSLEIGTTQKWGHLGLEFYIIPCIASNLRVTLGRSQWINKMSTIFICPVDSVQDFIRVKGLLFCFSYFSELSDWMCFPCPWRCQAPQNGLHHEEWTSEAGNSTNNFQRRHFCPQSKTWLQLFTSLLCDYCPGPSPLQLTGTLPPS